MAVDASVLSPNPICGSVYFSVPGSVRAHCSEQLFQLSSSPVYSQESGGLTVTAADYMPHNTYVALHRAPDSRYQPRRGSEHRGVKLRAIPGAMLTLRRSVGSGICRKAHRLESRKSSSPGKQECAEQISWQTVQCILMFPVWKWKLRTWTPTKKKVLLGLHLNFKGDFEWKKIYNRYKKFITSKRE